MKFEPVNHFLGHICQLKFFLGGLFKILDGSPDISIVGEGLGFQITMFNLGVFEPYEFLD